jgi:hypothetical protein
MRTPRLTDAPADLNGLVRFAERRNLVSARVPSHFNWPLLRTNTRYEPPHKICRHSKQVSGICATLVTNVQFVSTHKDRVVQKGLCSNALLLS